MRLCNGSSRMMMLAMLLLSTAAAGLNPLSQPVQRVDVGSGNNIVLHVPTDDAIMEAVMQKGHKMALEAGEELYDQVMEEFVTSNIGPAYWAQLWPSALALGRDILQRPSLFPSERQQPVLELGCGLGLASICAAKAGAIRVIATDIEPWALDFAAANAAENEIAVGASRFSAQRLDWADPANSSATSEAQSYGTVLAADVVCASAGDRTRRLLGSAASRSF